MSAITAANTGGTTHFVSGCANAQNCDALVNQSAVKAAVAAADVVLLVLGEAIGVTNQEGTDRQGYQLAGKQTSLAQLVGTLNKPTVVIMLSGGAVGMEWIATQTAWPLLVPGYSGIFGPRAIANTLFGDVAPSGMLPYTVYPDSCKDKDPPAPDTHTRTHARTIAHLRKLQSLAVLAHGLTRLRSSMQRRGRALPRKQPRQPGTFGATRRNLPQ